MARPFSLASQVALHVLERDGPSTTHRLHRACLAMEAPAPETARQHPGYRPWRLMRDGTIIRGTTNPPNPEHLVRSVKLLKKTMRELHAYGKVGHILISEWTDACAKANAHNLLAEAKVAAALAQDEKDSSRVWIDAKRCAQVLGEAALTPKPPRAPKRKGPIAPKYLPVKQRLSSLEDRFVVDRQPCRDGSEDSGSNSKDAVQTQSTGAAADSYSILPTNSWSRTMQPLDL